MSIAVGAACATPPLPDEALPEPAVSLRAAYDRMPAAARGSVRILEDNVDAWVARMTLIESAQKTLDVQYFIIEGDAYGMALLGLLAEKARDGVKVRLMVDARGTFELIRKEQRYLLQEVKRAGADVRVYNPIIWRIGEAVIGGDLRRVAASNHDKMIVVDGHAVIAGGRNLSKDYLSDPRDLAGAFIDLDAWYEGESVASRYTEAFVAEFNAKNTSTLWLEAGGDGQTALRLTLAAMKGWLADVPFTNEEIKASHTAADSDARTDAVALAFEGQLIAAEKTIPSDKVREALRKSTRLLAREMHLRGARTKEIPRISDDVDLRVLDTYSSESSRLKNTVNENLMLAVLSAHQKVIIQSPYLVLSDRGLRALEQVSANGVEIIVLTNSPASSDSPPTQAAFMRQWPKLLARAKTARLFVVAESRLMHAKVGIVDDQVAFVGSYNLDPLSAGVNSEVVAAIWSSIVATHLSGLVETRINNGAPGVVEYRIERDSAGNVIETDGEPVIAFGPENHCTPAQLAAAKKIEPFLDFLAPLL